MIQSLEGTTIVQVAGGAFHTVSLGVDGRVYTFGYGRFGRLGHGDTENKLVPTMITSVEDTDIVQIAARECHTILLGADGSVYTFGEGYRGRLGHGDEENKLVPTMIKKDATGGPLAFIGPRHVGLVKGARKDAAPAAGGGGGGSAKAK